MSLQLVKKVLERNNRWWLTPHDVQIILRRNGVFISDSTITARFRDLRKVQFGGYTVQRRVREGRKAHEYKLVKP